MVISKYSNYGRLAALMSNTPGPHYGFDLPTFLPVPISLNSLFTKHDIQSHRATMGVRTPPTPRIITKVRSLALKRKKR